MSCQSALQIRDNIDIIARASGDDSLKASGLPFDSVICPPDAAAKMLRTRQFFPRDKRELVLKRGAFWKDFNVYFRHECALRKTHFIEYMRKKVNVSRGHRELTRKFGYMSGKFRR